MATVLRVMFLMLAVCLLSYPCINAAGGSQYYGCNYEYGVDHTGFDGYLSQGNASSEEDCCRQCYYATDCHAFTWWSADEPGNSYGVANRCYMKRFLGPSVQNSKVVAGTIKYSP